MGEDKELEDEQGKVLPAREMMSLISTDPADPMYSTLVPADDAGGGPGYAGVERQPFATLPVEPPDSEGGTVTDADRDETITQTDSASAS